MKLRSLAISFICFFVCLTAQVGATNTEVVVNTKAELEIAIKKYEDLAVIAKNCHESSDKKSAPCTQFIKMFNDGKVNNTTKEFSNQMNHYFSIDQELTLRGITAVGQVIEALNFLMEK